MVDRNDASSAAAGGMSAADLRADLTWQVGSLIKAAHMLAEYGRVFQEFEGRAEYDRAFAGELGRCCAAWAEPDASGEGASILAALLQMLVSKFGELTQASEADQVQPG